MLAIILLIVLGVPFLSLLGYYWYLALFRREQFFEQVRKMPNAHHFSDALHLNATLIGFPFILLWFVIALVIAIGSIQ